jgi:hypothetical protein
MHALESKLESKLDSKFNSKFQSILEKGWIFSRWQASSVQKQLGDNRRVSSRDTQFGIQNEISMHNLVSINDLVSCGCYS